MNLEGGRVAGGWRRCARCGDDIWPKERVFPMVAGAVVLDMTFVLCVVCEVKRQIAVDRDAVRLAVGDESKDLPSVPEETPQ